jgi:hypothetical protein
MKEITLNTLNALEEINWFGFVGCFDSILKDDLSSELLMVSSWAEALANCSSNNWQNLLKQAVEQHRLQVLTRSKERFREWNLYFKRHSLVHFPCRRIGTLG